MSELEFCRHGRTVRECDRCPVEAERDRLKEEAAKTAKSWSEILSQKELLQDSLYSTEAEISHLKAEVKRLRGYLQMDANKLAADRDAWKARVEKSTCKLCEGTCGNHGIDCPDSITLLKAKADRLAGALSEMYDTFPCDHVVMFKPEKCCVCRAKAVLEEDENGR